MFFSAITVLATIFSSDGLRDTIDPTGEAGSALVPRDPRKSNSASYSFFLLHALGHLEYSFDFDGYARWQLSETHRAARVKTVSVFAKYFVV